jgi:hypothetical protein
LVVGIELLVAPAEIAVLPFFLVMHGRTLYLLLAAVVRIRLQ